MIDRPLMKGMGDVVKMWSLQQQQSRSPGDRHLQGLLRKRGRDKVCLGITGFVFAKTINSVQESLQFFPSAFRVPLALLGWGFLDRFLFRSVESSSGLR